MHGISGFPLFLFNCSFYKAPSANDNLQFSTEIVLDVLYHLPGNGITAFCAIIFSFSDNGLDMPQLVLFARIFDGTFLYSSDTLLEKLHVLRQYHELTFIGFDTTSRNCTSLTSVRILLFDSSTFRSNISTSSETPLSPKASPTIALMSTL